MPSRLPSSSSLVSRDGGPLPQTFTAAVARSPSGLLLEPPEQALRAGVAPTAEGALVELALSATAIHWW
jgi:hypothetical protein